MKTFFLRMKSKSKSPSSPPLHKIFWSWVGSFLGIYSIAALGVYLGLEKEGLYLIGSFGATAVLLYGAPLAEFAQPRNLVGGHILSALIGVTVFMAVGENVVLASSLAVSLSIVAMHFTSTLHPPGGATALIAVIGGEKIHSLGYFYVLNPVLVGVLIMLVVALLVNNLSADSKRHYPVYWM